jgi:glycosyltransferase involved in cell wall biosynthesis
MCPSYSEGMPNVILEAMTRGLAIMATDVGAIRLLVSKNNGILLKNCNEILILNAISEFLSMDKKLILNILEKFDANHLFYS